MTDRTIDMIIKEYALSGVPYDVPEFLLSDEERQAQRERAVAFGDPAAERSFEMARAEAHQRGRQSLPQVQQVLPGLAQGALGLIAGAKCVGKTTFGLALAMSVAAGRDLFRLGPNLYRPSAARKVVFLGLDESPDDYKTRVEKLLGDWPQAMQGNTMLRNNLLVQPVPKGDAHLMQLVETLSRLPFCGHDADLIVLDSLSRVSPKIDVENGKDLGAAIYALAAVGQKIGASIILMHEMKESAMKPEAKQQATAVIGSTALPDQCSWQLNLVPATGPEAGLVRVHNTKSAVARFRALTLKMQQGMVTRYMPPLARDSLGRFIPDPDRS